jgi:23S rRNA pseudouridine2457 synthase
VSKIILLNKPFDVLCQFTDEGIPRPTLADYIKIPNVYAAGRLDKDSEGLVLLTGDGQVQARISHPQFKLPKTYWVQVEGRPSDEAIQALKEGVELKDGKTRPALARIIEEPKDLWERTPPVRFRAQIPTTWIELIIREGKNRQVRRMTASIGHPTLRLIRYAIGPWNLDDLSVGHWKEATIESGDLPEISAPERSPRPHRNAYKTSKPFKRT